MSNIQQRRYPMNKPDGFVAGVQRYSANHPNDAKRITVMYLGVQSTDASDVVFNIFRADVQRLLTLAHEPDLFDSAKYVDPEGYFTEFVVAYWYETERFNAWHSSSAVSAWWQALDEESTSIGYFREVFTASIDHTETIAFQGFVRGLSACPMRPVEPVEESGYWGSARDRIASSAHCKHETAHLEPLVRDKNRAAKGNRIAVVPPKNMVLIRSGVSWTDCDDEQLQSYLNNVKPVLDKGMEYLRQNPISSGCCCMRQVEVMTEDDQATTENYCAGYFLSLAHLEAWAHTHPTHLAIYGRAQKERIKYQENLELKTYHEVFVIDQGGYFEYVSCHSETGLIPYFN